jgi:hypothetical protein
MMLPSGALLSTWVDLDEARIDEKEASIIDIHQPLEQLTLIRAQRVHAGNLLNH